ncbi:MAG TPA: JAB domain-containing protein [Allosphingosinicella sp.]|jgi:DNA repair protein RadC
MLIGTAEDAAALFRPFFQGAEAESVAVLHLDAERRVIGITRDAAGGTEDVELPLAAILGSALKLGAAAIVIAHNHPSGDPEPSAADRDATRRLAEAGAAMGVKLVDHLVFGGSDCRSMAALGWL